MVSDSQTDWLDDDGEEWLDSFEGIEMEDIPAEQLEFCKKKGILNELNNMHSFGVYHLAKRDSVAHYKRLLCRWVYAIRGGEIRSRFVGKYCDIYIIIKDNLVKDAMKLSDFILTLQRERSQVCLAVFLDKKSGKATDLNKEYLSTDQSLINLQ